MFPSVQLNAEQQCALDLIVAGRNVYMTGRAGTGKSTVLGTLRSMIPSDTVFLAPTGIAAINIAGETIHSFFGFPGHFLPPEFVPEMTEERRAKIKAVRTVVIDELSMVRADLLGAVDSTLRAVAPHGQAQLPFGGCQVVAVGDACQLPPVVACSQDAANLRSYFNGVHAFECPAWGQADFAIVALQTIHRQSDSQFVDILNGIRSGSTDRQHPETLRAVGQFNTSPVFYTPLDDTINLCATNAIAHGINARRDASLGGNPLSFRGQVSGHFEEDMFPVPLDFEFRIGSRVMMLANSPDGAGGYLFVNGDLGRVTSCVGDSDQPFATVRLDCGREVRVEPHTWFNQTYSVVENPWTLQPEIDQRVAGTYTQWPFKLAYAVTIHKAQGLSLDSAHLALGDLGTFAPGMLYTAMSRVRSLEGFSCDRPVRPNDIRCDPAVSAFQRRCDKEAMVQIPDPVLNYPQGMTTYPF